MIRWLVRISLSFILLIALCIVFLITPLGFQTVVKITQKTIPQLHIKKIKGSFIKNIYITGLEYNTSSADISIKNLTLRTNIFSLLIKKITLYHLTANDIQIELKETTEDQKSKGFELDKLHLPLTLSIHMANLAKINIEDDSNHKISYIQSVKIKNLNLVSDKISGQIITSLAHPHPMQANLKLKGKITNYRFSLAVTSKNMNWQMTGQGNEKSISATTQRAKILNGKLAGTISLQWYPILKWKTNLAIDNAKLDIFYPRLPTILHAKIISSGSWKKRIPQFQLDTEIKTANTTISAIGNHHANWNFHWKIATQDLHHLSPPLRGKIISTGQITGPTKAPIIKGNIEAHHLNTPWVKVANLKATADLDTSMQRASDIQLTADHMEVLHQNKSAADLSRLEIQAHGAPHAHSIKAKILVEKVQQDPITITTLLHGSLKNEIWKGILNALTIQSKTFGRWALQSPSKLIIAKNDAEISTSCWLSNNSKLCINGSWNETKGWEASVYGKLAQLNPWIHLFSHKAPVRIEGGANINLHAQGIQKHIHAARVRILSQHGKIHFNKEGIITTRTYQKFDINADLNKTGLLGQIAINLSPGNSLTGIINLPGLISFPLTEDQKISATLNLSFSDLKLLDVWAPALIKPSGQLVGQLEVTGTVYKPQLQSSLLLKNGNIEIPQLKITLKNVSLGINAQGQNVAYTINAESNNHNLQITGKTKVDFKDMQTHVSINAENILVANTIEYKIYCSPHFDIKVKGKTIDIKGRITIPSADIKPVDFSKTATLPNDVIIIGAKKSEDKPWLINQDINIKLGDKVFVDTRGLNARLTGELNITKKAEQPAAFGVGHLDLIKGSYDAQGKTLTIEPGSGVQYLQDPLSNPHLQIKATRNVTVNDTSSTIAMQVIKAQVGVSITGTLRRPVVNLFSTPIKLSQGDILSYLLFNQPSNDNTPGNVSMMINAVSALTLNTKGVGSTVERIKQRLGIVELGVEATMAVDALGTPLGIDQSAFVVGSFITPTIYVRYNRGLVTPINLFEVRWLFATNWALQLQTGSSNLGSGGDLLYTINRKSFP